MYFIEQNEFASIYIKIYKLDLLMLMIRIVDEAIRFVEESKEKLKISKRMVKSLRNLTIMRIINQRRRKKKKKLHK
jgi:hypothetical protein